MTDKKVRRPAKDPKSAQDIEWIDVHDDALMIGLGIRPRHWEPVVYPARTPKETQQLVTLRKVHKGRMHGGLSPKEVIPVKDKLIIQLKKNKRFPHTTYSIVCYQHDISQLINRYVVYDKNGNAHNVVAKYVFNGKTYAPNELPFWGI